MLKYSCTHVYLHINAVRRREDACQGFAVSRDMMWQHRYCFVNSALFNSYGPPMPYLKEHFCYRLFNVLINDDHEYASFLSLSNLELFATTRHLFVCLREDADTGILVLDAEII